MGASLLSVLPENHSGLHTTPILQWLVIMGLILIGNACLGMALNPLQQKNTSPPMQRDKLDYEHVRAQMEALKNQLDPHFLFNNLNTLSALIYTDQKENAIKFIDDLAVIYRYVLKNSDQELVALRTEIECVNAQIALLKARFMDAIQVEWQISSAMLTYYVPPLSLYRLIESLVSYTRIVKAHPWHIRIAAQRKTLVIQYMLPESDAIAVTDNSHFNILVRRYAYLTSRKIYITRTDQECTIKIPLLQLDESHPGAG